MASMGRYCKAYLKEQFQAFSNWKEKDWKRTKVAANAASQDANSQVEERDHYYLQENYSITADIFLDEEVVFDEVNQEWIAFCNDVLKFKEALEQALPVKAAAGSARN
jgi:hypothetical protein